MVLAAEWDRMERSCQAVWWEGGEGDFAAVMWNLRTLCVVQLLEGKEGVLFCFYEV